MKLTRRKLAQHVVAELEAGNSAVITETAAYLVSENRTKELPLLVRDIEAIYADHGVLVADITTAHKVSDVVADELAAEIGVLTGAKHVQARLATDPALLGGIRVQVPGAELDATVAGKLRKLRAAKV